MSLQDNVKNLISKLNQQGVPVPMLRDPVSGKPSVTLTMTFLSFNTCLLGQIGRLSRFLDGVDLSQANYLFMIALGAYLGRRLQGNATTKSVTLDDEKKEG